MHTPPPPLLTAPISFPPATHSSISNHASPSFPFLSILILVAVIFLMYAAFFAINCPPNPVTRLGRISGELAENPRTHNPIANNTDHLVSSVTYKAAPHGGECPVCLSAFMDGEVVREVNVCKHLFHSACIDTWLCSHSDCPVCRAFIGTRRSKPPRPPAAAADGGEGDIRQGLPDSASLV
ncbi:hypothetical protein CsSME_00038594 [Camellia sinensis var. sinensis]